MESSDEEGPEDWVMLPPQFESPVRLFEPIRSLFNES
jgi:hypothetical protein